MYSVPRAHAQRPSNVQLAFSQDAACILPSTTLIFKDTASFLDICKCRPTRRKRPILYCCTLAVRGATA